MRSSTPKEIGDAKVLVDSARLKLQIGIRRLQAQERHYPEDVQRYTSALQLLTEAEDLIS